MDCDFYIFWQFCWPVFLSISDGILISLFRLATKTKVLMSLSLSGSAFYSFLQTFEEKKNRASKEGDYNSIFFLFSCDWCW